jgi:hypothetical protein
VSRWEGSALSSSEAYLSQLVFTVSSTNVLDQ